MSQTVVHKARTAFLDCLTQAGFEGNWANGSGGEWADVAGLDQLHLGGISTAQQLRAVLTAMEAADHVFRN